MIREFVPWYLAITLSGWLVFPLAYRVLSRLPDRGFTLAKPLGLLLWAYLYWILVSLHILQNDIGGVLFTLLLVAGASAWALWKSDRAGLRTFLRENLRLILITEALFLFAFLAWAVVRAASPDASGTEKPMELAFINAILHSSTFPPHDPWLSGYAISYYYFGYVMVAMLARFSAVTGAVAFNLGVASWFALTAVAAFGVLYSLLLIPGAPLKRLRQKSSALAGALLAPLFVLLVSNFEGFLEVLHALGLFWQRGADGVLTSSFWQWLGIQELVNPPAEPFTWIPNRAGGSWWWWRASRVLQDFDIAHQPREIIDEFPTFSYLLGDLHPHVLSMPFVLLAIGLALHLYLRERSEPGPLTLRRGLARPDLWLAAVAFGGLAFLNTWDFPIYLALFGAAFLLARYERMGWHWQNVTDAVYLSGAVGLVAVFLYLPFYIGFQSQAGGLLPSLIFFTPGVQFWVMFGTLLLPILAWLFFLWRRQSAGPALQGHRPALGLGLAFAVTVVGGLWLLSSLMGGWLAGSDRFAGIYGGTGSFALLLESLMRRLSQPGAWITLALLLALVWALLASVRHPLSESVEPSHPSTIVPPESFFLLLVLLGSGLALFPEFFYLRDQFGWRMNTIFKFYFQAWIVWGIAAAYASARLWQALRGRWQAVLAVGWTALLLMALVYPFFGVLDRTNHFNPVAWTLDGTAYLSRYTPEDIEAIRWLSQAAPGVVVEAVGGSYSGYARVSTISGQPTVLGWPGHESQWRGGSVEIGTREPDIEQLYRAASWSQAQPILERYGIRYVYVGPMERGKYRVNEVMFQQYLKPVYQNAQVTIYEVSKYSLENEQARKP